mgnify:CR=1 FL=1
MSSVKPLISICVPVLNEEDNVGPLYQALISGLSPLEGRFRLEFVFTDNHSSDQTFARLHQLAQADPRIRVFRFARNVGFQKSILSGYLRANGDAVVQIDCDLQDPPSLIVRFVELWEQGYHVVYGVRRSRKEGWVIRQARSAFYFLVDKLSEYPLPRQAGDFRLVARPVIEAVRQMDDAFPYLRGVIAGFGYNQIGVEYDRDERRSGESKFNFRSLFALAIDGILATSIVPLRLAVYLGLLTSILSLVTAVGYIVRFFLVGASWPSGFATIAVLLTLGIGINALFLGVIGEYLGRIYTQSKKQPLSLVEYSIENGLVANHASAPGAPMNQINLPSFPNI